MADPYADIVKSLTAQSAKFFPTGMCLGRVEAVAENKLQIKADNGLLLEREDLMLNAELSTVPEPMTLDALSGSVVLGVNQSIPCSATVGTATLQSISLQNIPGTLSGSVRSSVQRSGLQVGDQVLLQPIHDGQMYVILCKVVTPTP